MKTVTVIRPDAPFNNQSQWWENPAKCTAVSKRFSNGENAASWVGRVCSEISNNYGNGWPYRVTVDGEYVDRMWVETKF